VFDMGPPLDQILANAQEETGLPAPNPPIVR
jgi:N-methylhydantoinase B